MEPHDWGFLKINLSGTLSKNYAINVWRKSITENVLCINICLALKEETGLRNKKANLNFRYFK